MQPTLLSFLGVLLALPVLVLVTFAFIMPVTVSGGFYLLGGLLVSVGLILAPWRSRAHYVLTLSGVVVILSVASVRVILTQKEASNLKVIVLPSEKRSRLLNTLIEEQDSLIFGERLMHLTGGVSPHEHEGIVSALSTVFREAKQANGVFASPIVSTYLGLQKPDAFDAVVVEPTVEGSAKVGVIFLHGFMGNVTVQCWQIAQAVEEVGALTVCPSTRWVGDWWQPDGEGIVRATFRYLRERGIQRIYMGGFSNGGSGVGRLVSTLMDESELSGLFFIAGARNAGEVRETNLPVLVIQGANDERMPVEAAHQFAVEVGAQATYVELEADHFLIMKQPRPVQEAISSWLEDQESSK